MQTENRVKMFEVPYDAVANLLMPTEAWLRVVESNLPEDTKVLHVETDPRSRSFTFYITSETFDPLKPGEKAERLYPFFTTTIITAEEMKGLQRKKGGTGANLPQSLQ